MLFKLSSASCSHITKELVKRELAYSYLQSALAFSKACRINLGILFCREFNASLCSGACSNGSSWGFSVFSRNGQYENESRQALEHQGLEYDIRRASVKINFFDMVLHHKLQSCGCDSFRIDICVPQDWCAKIYECDKSSAARAVKELLHETAGLTSQAAKQILEGANIVH